jgi:predicted metal-binding membrane protein
LEGRVIRKEPLHREHIAVLATLALLTVVAWVLTLVQMQDMAAMDRPAPNMGEGGMPGMSGPTGMAEPARPDPGVRLLLYLGMWVAMMAAMMLPSAAPMILMFGTVYRTKRERGGAFVPTWVFVAGYLATWAAFGACAWALSDVGEGLARAYPTLEGFGSRLAAVAMIGAAVYQLTPLKQRCLSHCRSPLSFVMHHWRAGMDGALRMGWEHGVYCVGCCWVLFVLLVIVGLSSLPWMGLITLIVCAEKLLPRGRQVTLGIAGLLFVLGLVTLVRPDLLVPIAA